jgi:uncharacterized short protein YbdD (DUF466 family)
MAIRMQSADFKRVRGSLGLLLLTLLLMPCFGCGPSAPVGSPPVTPAATPKSGSQEGVKKPIDQTLTDPAGSQKQDSPAESDPPKAVTDFPMPDLTLLTDAAFQRNAKMGRLVAKRRCILCHKIEGRGAVLQPPLVQVSMRRLKRMLDYDGYLDQLQDTDPDRFSAGQKTFDAIRQEENVLKSMRLWLKGYLKQPTFDNSQAKMPLQVLIPAEIEQLACYVIQLAVEGYQKGETPLED